jgi:hypothetical protein
MGADQRQRVHTHIGLASSRLSPESPPDSAADEHDASSGTICQSDPERRAGRSLGIEAAAAALIQVNDIGAGALM